MLKSGRLVAAFLSLLLAVTSWSVQASCSNKTPATTPTSRFITLKDKVYDRKTKLTWSRCPIGARWDRNRCVGAAKLVTHGEAQALAARAGSRWRLPSLEELESILEERCEHPAINARIFPGVVELYEGKAKYWSATPMEELPGLFYNLDFMEGIIDANTPGIAMSVRLVRTAKGTPVSRQVLAGSGRAGRQTVLNTILGASSGAAAVAASQGHGSAVPTPSLRREQRLGPTLRRVIRSRHLGGPRTHSVKRSRSSR